MHVYPDGDGDEANGDDDDDNDDGYEHDDEDEDDIANDSNESTANDTIVIKHNMSSQHYENSNVSVEIAVIDKSLCLNMSHSANIHRTGQSIYKDCDLLIS